ncbi:CPBP family intramembrane metalloprotease [Leucobacter sp. UT-8R-CII-1-4]|uniref:CPBP family intramembrane glutamic endopeptidase n=1 Tax=Leucobacter sp. UT-8R-CII-1-4 TaxID=3040075 RepID=UPI0024A9DF90|nr:CPBP family intramembrane glutamic endopeptidase [Leucobacter sp. UT-8R-CII-1-4]MDI6022836.1 CPBP family intramembrane metalloprotease [Leucobacter sp. UT-8R-CII-1-4]
MSFSPDQPQGSAPQNPPAGEQPNPESAVPPVAPQQPVTPQPPVVPQQLAPQQPLAPQPAWALPRVIPQWVETEPLEYHQLLRGTPRFRWWKPVAGLAIGVAYYITLSVAFSLIIFMVAALNTSEPLSQDMLLDLALPDTQNPLSMLMGLGSLALMIPAALLAMLSVGFKPAGRLWSVALRIRWRWIGRTILPAFVALFVINSVGIALSLAFDGGASESVEQALPADFDMNAAIWSVILILLLVPLQATSEELIFRGAFMQAIGSWRNKTWFVVLLAVGIPLGALMMFAMGGTEGLLEQGSKALTVMVVVGVVAYLLRKFTGSPFVVIAVPSVLFAMAHIYEIWGMLSVTAMALTAAWLTWRTGGLEAAITIHVVNNLFGFMFMVFAFGGETGQTAEGGSPFGVIAAICGQVLYAWWVDRDFRKNDGRRTRIDYVEVLVPVQQVASQPVQQDQFAPQNQHQEGGPQA